MPKSRNSKLYLYKRIVRAKMFIDQHYLDTLDISTVAAVACLSKFHFLRLFKQIYGITPHHYLTSLRIEKARSLLREGTSISAVCHTLGFESLSSFNKLFRRYTQFTPLAYSKWQRNLHKKMTTLPLEQIPASFVEYLGWNK